MLKNYWVVLQLAASQEEPPWSYLVWCITSWRWRQYIPPERRWDFTGLHGVKSQKILVFKQRIFPKLNQFMFDVGTNHFKYQSLRCCIRGSHSGDYEQCQLLGCDVVLSGRSSHLFLSDSLLGLISNPDDGDYTFHRNNEFLPDFTAIHLRGLWLSWDNLLWCVRNKV
jgi:hypothetical protein